MIVMSIIFIFFFITVEEIKDILLSDLKPKKTDVMQA